MDVSRILTAVFLVVGCLASSMAGAASPKLETEAYVREPMPPGIQVIDTELEGPVFANAQGHTLYMWPSQIQRNSSVGEAAGKAECYDVHYRETAGIRIPYPAGLELPNADHRPTCVEHFPPVYAAADAKPVGNFTILNRTDGTKQWAYKEYALYTSHLDSIPGQTNGGMHRPGRDPVSAGARRIPAKPSPQVPPKFDVAIMVQGRILVTDTAYSIYSYDKDTATKSNCYDACLLDWEPMLAPDTAIATGEWTLVQRTGGRMQWAFRGKPLYRYLQDTKERSYDGSDIPGWHNVFVKHAPPAPPGFHAVDADGGEVLADPQGKTIYFYSCNEDTPDTLNCDDVNSPQVYRFAICGAGDPQRCLKMFPYVIADKNAKATSTAWTVKDIDPNTGHYVAAGTLGSLHIWAYRDRPVYTYAGDHAPGDIFADNWGTAFGHVNGYTAFWLRDIFYGNGQLD